MSRHQITAGNYGTSPSACAWAREKKESQTSVPLPCAGEEAAQNALVIAAPRALKLVEYAVVFVQVTELAAEVIVYRDCLGWP